jgi:flagellar biosynthesis protein FlhB
MADESPDKEQKTLDPSVKRYEDAYKKGQAPISKDFNNFAFLVVCLGVFAWILPWCLRRTLDFLTNLVPVINKEFSIRKLLKNFIALKHLIV